MARVEPNGVADYSLALARALAARNGVKSVFLSATPSAQAMPMQDEWKTVFLRRRQAQCMADTFGRYRLRHRWLWFCIFPAMVIKSEVSRYGWLRAFASGARRARHVPLVTIFHELYASGRPWQSAFWLSPLQKHIARSILNLSSLAITPTDLYRKRLSRWRKDSAIKITAMPVFSNVGEPSCVAPPCARARYCCCLRSCWGGGSSFWHLSFRNRTHHRSVRY